MLEMIVLKLLHQDTELIDLSCLLGHDFLRTT